MGCGTLVALTEIGADGVKGHSGAGAHDRGKATPAIASLDAPIGGRDDSLMTSSCPSGFTLGWAT
jgi:hypothetical protein